MSAPYKRQDYRKAEIRQGYFLRGLDFLIRSRTASDISNWIVVLDVAARTLSCVCSSSVRLTVTLRSPGFAAGIRVISI